MMANMLTVIDLDVIRVYGKESLDFITYVRGAVLIIIPLKASCGLVHVSHSSPCGVAEMDVLYLTFAFA